MHQSPRHLPFSKWHRSSSYERRINSESFVFSLFDTLFSTWKVLEEPAQPVATDSSWSPKPLVRILDNLDRVMQKEPAPGWPESKHLPLSHSTTHPNTSQNKMGKQATVLKGTLESKRGVEAVEHTGNNKDERWKGQWSLHCVRHQRCYTREGVDGVKIWASHTDSYQITQLLT